MRRVSLGTALFFLIVEIIAAIRYCGVIDNSIWFVIGINILFIIVPIIKASIDS